MSDPKHTEGVAEVREGTSIYVGGEYIAETFSTQPTEICEANAARLADGWNKLESWGKMVGRSKQQIKKHWTIGDVAFCKCDGCNLANDILALAKDCEGAS